MAEMFHYFAAHEDGAIDTVFPGLEAVQGELNSQLLHLAGLVRIAMLDGHIEPMGDMGFFTPEIIYGKNAMLAPAKSLPYP
ncbi:hypothetical protein E2562_005301, partial [Oryza meyeriana var. granulata]